MSPGRRSRACGVRRRVAGAKCGRHRAPRQRWAGQPVRAPAEGPAWRACARSTRTGLRKTRTSLAVVESACVRFALRDVAVGGCVDSLREPDIGAYLDVLVSRQRHPVKTADAAEAYLSRLNAYPGALTGDSKACSSVHHPQALSDRAVKSGGEPGVARPARAGGGLAKRTRDAGIAGEWGPRAERITKGAVSRVPPARRIAGATTEGDDGRRHRRPARRR